MIKNSRLWKKLSEMYWIDLPDAWLFHPRLHDFLDGLAVSKQLPSAYQRYRRLLHFAQGKKFNQFLKTPTNFRRLLNLFANKSEKQHFNVQIGDLKVWIQWADPRGFGVIYEIAKPDSDANCLIKLLKPKDTFIDIGGNHGSFSLLACQKVGPQGNVFCFEPQPTLNELIQRSQKDNRFDHMRVESYALSNQVGTTSLFIGDGSSGTASCSESIHTVNHRKEIPIQCITGDSYFSNKILTGSILIKIDVEGHEIQVLQGMRSFLERNKPRLLLEFNPTASEASKQSFDSILVLLKELDYSHYQYLNTLDQITSIHQFSPPNVNTNILFTQDTCTL